MILQFTLDLAKMFWPRCVKYILLLNFCMELLILKIRSLANSYCSKIKESQFPHKVILFTQDSIVNRVAHWGHFFRGKFCGAMKFSKPDRKSIFVIFDFTRTPQFAIRTTFFQTGIDPLRNEQFATSIFNLSSGVDLNEYFLSRIKNFFLARFYYFAVLVKVTYTIIFRRPNLFI